jgi:endo-1,3-1,4-beta-glycanase ExoK
MKPEDHACAVKFNRQDPCMRGFPRNCRMKGEETISRCTSQNVLRDGAPSMGRQRGSVLASMCCIVVALQGFAGAALAEEQNGSAFFDPFDSLDNGFWFTSDGWSNGAHQNCTWSKTAVAIADGMLRLSFLPGEGGSDPGHLCGEIQTNATYHHGTYEARMRTSRGSGLNAAFFTYIGPVHEAPHDEIDVEILTRDTGGVSLNTFVDGKPQNGKTVPINPPTDQAFHTYAFTWEPDGISWFIDGKQVHRAEGILPVTPQKIFFSHWGSDTFVDWMGPFEVPEAPVIMEVDWVAFTPLGTPCKFPESVLCQAR